MRNTTEPYPDFRSLHPDHCSITHRNSRDKNIGRNLQSETSKPYPDLRGLYPDQNTLKHKCSTLFHRGEGDIIIPRVLRLFWICRKLREIYFRQVFYRNIGDIIIARVLRIKRKSNFSVLFYTLGHVR